MDGYSRIPDMVRRAKELGQEYVAITDHGEVSGHLVMAKEAAAQGLGAIYGMEGYWLPDIAAAREAKVYPDPSHITLLAASDTGLRNLWALSSIAYDAQHYYYKPNADPDLLRTYAEGLYASDGCLMTRFAEAVLADREDEAKQYLGTLLDIFRERFFMELHTWQYYSEETADHQEWNAKMRTVNQAKVRLATEMGVPLVVVNDSHHAYPEDWENGELLFKFNTGQNPDQLDGAGQIANYMMGDEELYYWMERHGISREVVAEAITNSHAIAQSCRVQITPALGVPKFSASETDDLRALINACEEGFQRHVTDEGLDEDPYYARLEEELRLIADKHFCFPAGTQVTTGLGDLINIEALRPGDLVLTQSGAQPVGAVSTHEVSESLVELSMYGTYRVLAGTDNHPVLTPQGWKPMGEVVVGDELAADTLSEGVDMAFELRSLATYRGWEIMSSDGPALFWTAPPRKGFVRGGTGKGRGAKARKGWAPDKLEPSPELMYLLGLWVAEGHLYDPDSATCPGQVGWTLHCDEYDVVRRLQHSLTQLGLGKLRSYSKASACAPEHRGMSHMVTNHPLALFLQEVVGSGLQNKRLGSWIMSLSSETLRHFVKGWFDGDGTLDAKGRKHLATSNSVLAFQLRQILLRSGVWATEIEYDNKGRKAYRVCWQETRIKAPYGARHDGRRWWVKVRSVSSRPHSGVVYNLSVDGDPTYVAEGVRVHNSGYFLMVRDYTSAYKSGAWSQYVKPKAAKEPMLIGPGRGSAGGSLVAYLLGITLVDPIKYGTLFSRFLTPGRKGLPDIDVDVPQSQRPAMLAYISKRFGHDNVCAIGTFSRSGPKATLRDLCRVYKIPRFEVDAMSDHIAAVERMKDSDNPDEDELTWSELIERKGGELRPWQAKYPEMFEKLEAMSGLIRQTGTHAAGVLVSSTPLMGAIPLRTRKHNTKDEVVTTQVDMNEVEELGGVKLDLLGLRHLDTLRVAQQLIYEHHGLWVDYWRDGLSVPPGCTNVLRFGGEHFRDPAIYEQIDKGHTLGIFQVMTSTGTDAAVQFKPRTELEMADLTAIVRPGVADAGLKEVYLRRRAGLEPVVYDHPLMERIVGPKWATNTYGILVYQEQLIEAVQLLASFTADEADDLRKAVGKKNMAKLAALKDKFVTGCLNNKDYYDQCPVQVNAPRQIAEKIWDSIEASGRYAFNWSHAVEYGGFISTWETWTKHYYPHQFLVACMQTDPANTNLYIREARRRGIAILPPDINLSAQKFTIEGNAIRYGIDTVRSVGPAASRAILAGRPYTSFADFLARATDGTKKTALINLIWIGAFDTFDTRENILRELEQYRVTDKLAESTLLKPDKLDKVLTRRFTDHPEKYSIEIPDFSDPETMYEIEKTLVGTYVTVDPMARYVPALDKTALREPTDMFLIPPGNEFIVGGQLTEIRPTVTKKGKTPGAEMAHITVAWNDAEFRVVCFPEAWASARNLLTTLGVPVACKVKKLDSGCCLLGVERLDLLWQREGLE